MGLLDGILELATEETYLDGYRRRDKAREYQREVLAFRLGQEEYAVDILRLREILKPRPVTEVPRAPSFVPGVLSVRGEVMPIVDLRKRLRLPVAPEGRETRILVAKKGDEAMGLVVDGVKQVVKLRDEEVEPPPQTIGGIEEFVSGIGRPNGSRMLILLNLDAVLSFEVKGRGGMVA